MQYIFVNRSRLTAPLSIIAFTVATLAQFSGTQATAATQDFTAPSGSMVVNPDAQSPATTWAADPTGTSGLLADIERIVTSEESNDWFIERKSMEAIYPVVLQSVCRASMAARRDALATLAIRRASVGDAKALFAVRQELDDQVEAALHVERMHNALTIATQSAVADCPFYILPQNGYNGRQTDRNQFTISIETGGLVQFRYTESALSYGGGGALRILPGYGFGKLTLLGGLEISGGAMIKASDTSKLILNYFPTIPVVARLRGTTWHADTELAAVSWVQSDNRDISFGGRIGFTIGVSALRNRFIIPWAGIGVAYEYFPSGDARPAAHFLRGGVRLGFQWAPG
jgi:hypothetical protein